MKYPQYRSVNHQVVHKKFEDARLQPKMVIKNFLEAVLAMVLTPRWRLPGNVLQSQTWTTATTSKIRTLMVDLSYVLIPLINAEVFIYNILSRLLWQEQYFLCAIPAINIYISIFSIS